MIHVILSRSGTYNDIVEFLVKNEARLTDVGLTRRPGTLLDGKLSIIKAMLNPKLRFLRGLWTRHDRVLIIGWQSLPIIAAIRCNLLVRPKRVLVMACFVHSKRARPIVNCLWRYLKFPGLGFIAFSHGEELNLINSVGIDKKYIHFHLWRQDLYGRIDASSVHKDDSVFAGGYSNRDYNTLLRAMTGVEAKLTIVASSRNSIDREIRRENTSFYFDVSEMEFENYLAKSSVVVMPLLSQGEACGQSVLLRVLRNRKPLIATRHESIELYLGEEYSGFVEPGDENEMRDAINSAINDKSFREKLTNEIMFAAARIDGFPHPGLEIKEFIESC